MPKEEKVNTTVEDISATKKRLKIEIPTDIIEKEYSRSLDNVRQRTRLPGFRQGKAPLPLIEKRFGNDIKADIIDRLVPEYYTKAMKDADLVPVTLPAFEGSLDLKRNEPLSFALTIEVRPKIENLSYEGMKVEAEDVRVEDKEVEETLKGMQEERAMFEAVDREIKDDDLIVIDYVKLDTAGEKEIASAKDQVMNLGRGLTPNGILDEILGRKKGDVVEVTLPSVEGGEIKEDTAGGRLRITVKEVKEKKLPALDDEFAKDLGLESLEALAGKVRDSMLKAKKDRAAGRQKDKLLETLVSSHEFDIPETFLNKELEKLVMNEQMAGKKASADPEQAGEEDEHRRLTDELRPKAVQQVKASILLDMIADKEGVTVTEDELKARLGMLARHFQTSPENVINFFITRDGSLDVLKQSIRDEKALDIVLERAEKVKGA